MENKELEKIAHKIREDVLEMIYTSQSGHIGGSFSIAEILSVIYFHESNITKKNVKDINRDKVILSKGHACPAIYSVLKQKGILKENLLDLRKFGSPLQGHPDMNKVLGIDYSTGSLGQGLSVGVGMAYIDKKEDLNNKVFCIIGDGEIQEGQMWEALNSASKLNLSNLYIILDNNKIQLDGETQDIGYNGDIVSKIKSFGLEVIRVDGHDVEELKVAFDVAKKIDKPVCIIADTIKAKGVSFMENTNVWHGKAPNDEQYLLAKEELNG